MDLKPRARKEDIVVQSLADEVLVYDLKRHKAHCLNDTAVMIWKHCDGKTDIAGMRRILEKELKTQIDEDVIFLGLEQLKSRHLLVNDSIGTAGKMSPARRAALKKLGAAALISLPAIISLVAPTAASAQTALIPPGQCNAANNGRCCTNNRRCNGSSCADPC